MIDRRRAAVLGALLFVVYHLNVRAIGSRDTHVTEYLAFSMAAYGRADLDAFPDLHETGLAKGYLTRHDGRVRSNYPIVPAALAVPVYWALIASGVTPIDRPRQVWIEAAGKVAASAATAMACSVLFLVARRRLDPPSAAAIALAAGLATPLWSSAAQALWSHGAGALCLALAFLFDEEDEDAGAPRAAAAAARAAGSGAAFALAAACRPLLACFAAGAVVAMLAEPRRRRRLPAFLGAALAVAAGMAAYNVSAFGSLAGGTARLESPEVHRMAHGVSSAWAGNPLEGLAGVLVSPSRGLMVFMPIVFFAVVGAARAWRGRSAARWRLVVPTTGFVLAWSSYAVWWGGHSYGPRYAADLALPLALLAAAALEAPSVWRRSRASRAAVAAALAWSVGVQALGAFAYPRGEWNGRPADVDLAHERLWDWRDSQIPRTLRAGTGLFSTDPSLSPPVVDVRADARVVDARDRAHRLRRQGR